MMSRNAFRLKGMTMHNVPSAPHSPMGMGKWGGCPLSQETIGLRLTGVRPPFSHGDGDGEMGDPVVSRDRWAQTVRHPPPILPWGWGNGGGSRCLKRPSGSDPPASAPHPPMGMGKWGVPVVSRDRRAQTHRRPPPHSPMGMGKWGAPVDGEMGGPVWGVESLGLTYFDSGFFKRKV